MAFALAVLLIATAPTTNGVTVHLVPHSHQDVAWLKSHDEYYTGDKNNIQHANVRAILDAVIAALLSSPTRTFTAVEIAFFSRWFGEQTPAMKEAVRGMVTEGRLSFSNAGWSMPDEAASHWMDLIDNVAIGHRFLFNEIGPAAIPSAQWQVDPFGHSCAYASLFSSPSAGFHSVFFARADYQDTIVRALNKSTEWLWSPSPSLGAAGSTLGVLLPDFYYPPDDMNFGDDGVAAIVDDPALENFNLAGRVDAFVADALTYAAFTPGDDQIWPMGSDFSYENAFVWYENMDRIIAAVNADGRVAAKYSSPATYATAKIRSLHLTTRADDMFPMADSPHAVWSGFFTSRPALKGYIRECGAVQTAARQLQLFGGGAVDTSISNSLYLLERAMGLAQHHDAVTGTSRQSVTNDYARRLSAGRAAADAGISLTLTALTKSAPGTAWASCDIANATICPALESGTAAQVVLVYNPGSQASAVHVRLPVGTPAGILSYAVTGPAGAPVPAQLAPLSAADAAVRAYYAQPAGAKLAWLQFIAPGVPALGYAAYFVEPSASMSGSSRSNSGAATLQTAARALRVADTVPAAATPAPPFAIGDGARAGGGERGAAGGTITNGIISLAFDASTGFLSSYTRSGMPAAVPLTMSVGWWNASKGGPRTMPDDTWHPSGAYVFRPTTDTALIPVAAAASTELITGAVASEARLVYAPWLSIVLRLWANASDVEVEWTVGPIPFSDGLGREVVIRYGTGLATAGMWYSDSNGRDSMRRMRNARPSWPLVLTEPVADNYVPVTAFQWLSDNTTTLSVVTDRAQGGTSLTDGELEFMVHRRLLVDDECGVVEPLNETGLDGLGLLVRGTHRLSLAPAAAAPAERSALVSAAVFRPLLRFAPLGAGVTPSAWLATHSAQFTGLGVSLPPSVAVATLHSRAPGSLLLRLVHSGEAGDGPAADPVTVRIGALLANYSVGSVTELTLPGVVPLAAAPVVNYTRADGSVVSLPVVPPASLGPDFAVTLTAMQVRTFEVAVTPRAKR